MRVIRNFIDIAKHSHYLAGMKISSPLLTRRGLLAMIPAFAVVPQLARAAGDARIVATTGMIADAARRIGGGEVTALMGPGIDPHSYRQTRSDIATLVRADLVLWHGLRLEAQLVDMMENLSKRVTVVAVAEGMEKDKLLSAAAFAGHYDPHVWMDPQLWLDPVEKVKSALTGLMPDATDSLAANHAGYRAEIQALDSYARSVLSSVPAEARVLVTAHDAFSYFGRAYGFEVQGIQGISTESEAGLSRIGELVDMLVARQIRAVFVESSVPDRAMRALVEGCKARGHDIGVGGELYSDAMGPDGTYEGTYPGMIDHNVTVIARALGGEAPLRGLAGRLSAGA